MKINVLFTVSMIAMLSMTCKEKKSASVEEQVIEKIPVEYNIENLEGNYVTKEYSRRDEGYDWVVVTISALNNSEAFVTVRSRADKKKATCTFEGKGSLTDASTIKVEFEGKSILFMFKDKTLSIST